MKTIVMVIFVLLVSSPAICADDFVDGLFSEYIGSHRPAVAVAVIKDRQTVVNRAYGHQTLVPLVHASTSTRFYLASLAKQFTGAAIAKLMDMNLIEPDAQVSKYIPELPEYANGITIDHLLRHTSGLPWDVSICFSENPPTNFDVLRMLWAQDALKFEPGSRFEYSNTGYAGDYPSYEENSSLGCGFTYGAGSLYSSIDDLIKWVKAVETNQLVTSQAAERIFSMGSLSGGDPVPYGYGWVLGQIEGESAIYHGGIWLGGARNEIAYIPSRRLWVILLANHDDLPILEIRNKLIQHY